MNSAQFNKISFQGRTSLLLNKGKYFDERVEYGKCIWKYYLLFHFVVEVEHSIHNDTLINITALEPLRSSPNTIFQESDEIYYTPYLKI